MDNISWGRLIRKSFVGMMIFLLSFVSFLAPAGSVLAAADVTKPTFKGITIDKKEGTVGDTIEVSVDAEDTESGIKKISLYYQTPVTKKDHSVSLSYNPETKKYVGQIYITDEIESGIWKVNYISLYDNANNRTVFYNSNIYNYTSDIMDFSHVDFSVSGTNADTTKPSLKNIHINKPIATAGDTIEISVDAEDTESGIKKISLYYQTPVTKKDHSVSLSYNPETKKYVGQIYITDEIESGIWKVNYISLYDNANNRTVFYNSNIYNYTSDIMDFSHVDFSVSGTNADTTKPSLKNIHINKPIATAGDTIEISVDAEDTESGIKKISLYYQTPVTKKDHSVSLSYNPETKKYVGQIYITDEIESGIWKVNYISLYDNANNRTVFYNSNIYNYTSDIMDFSHVDFTVSDDPNPIQPLPQQVVKTSTTWSQKTIDGDLYIAPNATLTVNGNVTVNGNIYVLGSILNYGDLTVNGTMHAQRFLWGSYSTYNGTVSLLGGHNSIRGMTASNRVLNDIPFSIYTQPLVAKDGVISFEGATLPIVDMAIEGEPVKLNDNGTFRVTDFNIGDKDTLTVTFTDIFFNTITKVVPLQVIDTVNPTANTSVKGGYYSKGKFVELTMSEKGNIYYTLDGSIPTKTSRQYEQPIEINEPTILKYVAVDQAGNYSEVYTEEFSFISADDITDQSETVTGKGKPQSTVTIRVGNKEWTNTVHEDGTFVVSIPKQTAGQTVSIFAKDQNGLQSDTIERVVKDVTAPAKPIISTITDQSIELMGQAEGYSTISLLANGKEIASTTASADGIFIVTFPAQTAGTEISISATDKAGNTSELAKTIVQDVTAPNKPEVNPVTDQSAEISGTTEAHAAITVLANEKEIASTTAKEDGTFTVTLPIQTAGTELSVSATDKAGNTSEVTKITVQDGTTPNKPEVNAITDQSTEVTGKAEQETTIHVLVNDNIIGTATAEKNGTFTVTIPAQAANTEIIVTATDKAGNTSEQAKVIVQDVTAPSKLEVNEITNYTKEVTGKTEPHATVTVMTNETVIASTIADEQGNFTASIPVQAVGTELSITAKDKAGNTSAVTKVTVTQGQSGWVQVNNHWYYYEPSTGEMKTGWTLVNNTWYYFHTNGIMQTNWQFINGSWYFFNQSGSMLTNWQLINGSWYFFSQSGSMLSNWQLIDGSWYFFNQSGSMLTNWQLINGSWYFFNQSGTMLTSWQFINGSWYFFNQSGTMLTGWQFINGSWYFFYQGGQMAANTTIDGYKLNSSGVLIS